MNECTKSPSKLRKENEVLRRKLAWKVGALRNARKREVRLVGKVANLLEDLRQNRLLTDQASDLLEAYKDIPLHLFRRKEKGQAFTSDQQQFASTLHYYSAAAYSYVREKFLLCQAQEQSDDGCQCLAENQGLPRSHSTE